MFQALLLDGKDVDKIEIEENSQDVTVAKLGVVDVDKEQSFHFSTAGSTQFYIAGDELKVNLTLWKIAI